MIYNIYRPITGIQLSITKFETKIYSDFSKVVRRDAWRWDCLHLWRWAMSIKFSFSPSLVAVIAFNYWNQIILIYCILRNFIFCFIATLIIFSLQFLWSLCENLIQVKPIIDCPFPFDHFLNITWLSWPNCKLCRSIQAQARGFDRLHRWRENPVSNYDDLLGKLCQNWVSFKHH